MNKLIEAINEKCFSCDDVGGVSLSGWVVEFDDVKELIETMLAHQVQRDSPWYSKSHSRVPNL